MAAQNANGLLAVWTDIAPEAEREKIVASLSATIDSLQAGGVRDRVGDIVERIRTRER